MIVCTPALRNAPNPLCPPPTNLDRNMVKSSQCLLDHLTWAPTSSRKAWYRGGTHEGMKDGWTFSSSEIWLSRSCQWSWRSKISRPGWALWELQRPENSRQAHTSSCSSRWRKIYKINKKQKSKSKYPLLPSLCEAPETEAGLEQVVAPDKVLQIVRGPASHQPDTAGERCLARQWWVTLVPPPSSGKYSPDTWWQSATRRTSGDRSQLSHLAGDPSCRRTDCTAWRRSLWCWPAPWWDSTLT